MHTPFLADVYGGEIRVRDRPRFRAHVAALSGEVVLTIGRRRKNRSENQNRYYWGCVIKLASEWCGYYPDEMHEAFKFMFLRREEPGKPPTVLSTARLTTMEFSEFVDRCREWCAAQGVNVPDPLSFYEGEKQAV